MSHIYSQWLIYLFSFSDTMAYYYIESILFFELKHDVNGVGLFATVHLLGPPELPISRSHR